MNNEINSNTTLAEDSDFHMAFGWLAATAVSIASWAGLA
jgi:hypothetical protein